MGMTPHDFLFAFVEGNHDDCVKDPGCVRRAFNAAVSASHLADHYWKYHRRHTPKLVAKFKTLHDYVEHITKETDQHFQDIRSIANAYKHLYEDTSRNRGKANYWSVSSAGSIDYVTFERKSSPLKSIESDYSSAESMSPEFKVIFHRRDGTQHDFLPALERVIKFWSSEVYRDA